MGKAPVYNLGDRVWLKATNNQMDRPMKKLDDKKYGPFKIIQEYNSNYELEIPKSWKVVHPVFNKVLLSPYHDLVSLNQRTNKEPLGIEKDQPTFEVDKILDSNVDKNGNLMYLVHWKGYPIEGQTWETARDVSGARSLVNKFHSDNPLAPRAILKGRIRFIQNSYPPNFCPKLHDWSSSDEESDHEDVIS